MASRLSGGLRLVDIPLDILANILEYLTFRDLIALSLTTSGLRYVCPAPLDEDTGEKSFCFASGHLRLLPRSPNEAHGESQGHGEPHGPEKCPYCGHELCSAACATALFLDSDVGIFYPRHLFPTHHAIFKYSPNSPDRQNTLLPPTPSGGRPRQYSTIWCEHHRCPRDLFAPDSGLADKARVQGINNFLVEYHSWRWGPHVNSTRLGYWLHDQWLVGHKPPANDISHPQPSEQSNVDTPTSLDPTAYGVDEPIPVHEKSYYRTICLHCLGHCQPWSRFRMRGLRVKRPPEYICRCRIARQNLRHEQHHILKPDWKLFRGCRSCGNCSVRFDRIEGFDFVDESMRPQPMSRGFRGIVAPEDGSQLPVPRQGLWVYLATECKASTQGQGMLAVPAGASRMQAVDMEENARALRIVRGYDIIPLPPMNIGVQHLPYNVLEQILGYVTLDNRSCGMYRSKSALEASYCFLKASRRDFSERWGVSEPYSVMANRCGCSQMQRRRNWTVTFDFSNTEMYMLGQCSHKSRRMQLESQRLEYRRLHA
ncbi:hypothetical protein TWF696_008445 [Orbilia brochopaga]|uniref:F-box domain-containing protein n=1 Tax=Orbilia brochopaga TaxID=3140254 RepID=A0AAV9UHZ8_9PEZI